MVFLASKESQLINGQVLVAVRHLAQSSLGCCCCCCCYQATSIIRTTIVYTSCVQYQLL
eukprot:COSAG06_NODE_759_length_12508_cov_9.809171_16_plen_59_part_00